MTEGGSIEAHITHQDIDQGQYALLHPSEKSEKVRILAFHGGGGVAGSPEMLTPFCTTLVAGSSICVASASYRTLNRDKASIEQMFEDAVRALDWAKRTAPAGMRLFVMGASFGGLLALHAVYGKPEGVDGLILLNAVTDISAGGFSNRVVPEHGLPHCSPLHLWRNWSGAERLRVLLVHGLEDDVVPASDSERFKDALPRGKAELLLFAGVGHGFFNRPPHLERVATRVRQFVAA